MAAFWILVLYKTVGFNISEEQTAYTTLGKNLKTTIN